MKKYLISGLIVAILSGGIFVPSPNKANAGKLTSAILKQEVGGSIFPRSGVLGALTASQRLYITISLLMGLPATFYEAPTASLSTAAISAKSFKVIFNDDPNISIKERRLPTLFGQYTGATVYYPEVKASSIITTVEKLRVGVQIVQAYTTQDAYRLKKAHSTEEVQYIDGTNVGVDVAQNNTTETYSMAYRRIGQVMMVRRGNFIGRPVSLMRQYGGVLGQENAQVVIGCGKTFYGTIDYANCWPASQVYKDGKTYDFYAGEWSMTPTLASTAVVKSVTTPVTRPQNDDIVFMVPPRCTQGKEEGWFTTTVWISCITYGLSADGKAGTALYYKEESGFGGFLGWTLTLPIIALDPTLFTGNGIGLGLGFDFDPNLAAKAATMPGLYGTVKNSNWLGLGIWNWKGGFGRPRTAVNGTCGSDNGKTLSSQPINLPCSAGTPSAISGTGPWSWTCFGVNGGTNALCSANLDDTEEPVNGVCGPDAGKTLATTPGMLCSAGAPSTVSGYGGSGDPWTWSCYGLFGGVDATCSANGAVGLGGTCGTDNGKTLSAAPTNLCETGVESAVSGTGPWNWTCSGTPCSANRKSGGRIYEVNP